MKKYIIVLMAIFSFNIIAQSDNEFVDFSKIKKVLKQDGLDEAVKKKSEEDKQKKSAEFLKQQKKYDMPRIEDFWGFMSEYWLIKNAPILKWDFKKVEYGVADYFGVFLEKFGFRGIKYRILYLDAPILTHMALPANHKELIFLISVPFIRTLDLTKIEISLLMFEDFLRSEFGYFKANVQTAELISSFGTNFYGKKLDQKILETMLKNYDNMVWNKGFTIKEQHTVTKQMSHYLMRDINLWGLYRSLLSKIDKLVKGNIIYKNYPATYPSPELQLKWTTEPREIL